MRKASWLRWCSQLAAVVAALTAPILATPGVAAAAPQQPHRLEIQHKHDVATFGGHVDRFGPVGGPQAVDICQYANCVHERLDVELPPGTWQKPGGVQATISWEGKFNDILYLAVTHNGQVVGVSDASVSNFQSVRLNKPGAFEHSTPNGVYDMYIAYAGYEDPDNSMAPPSPVIKFKGWVDVQFETKVQPVRDLLPDVVALPPRSVTFDHPPAIKIGDGPADYAPPGSSCFVTDIAEGAHVCLRIEQRDYILPGPNNGAVEITWDAPVGVDQDEPALQVIHRSDGSVRTRSAGVVEWHKTHGHWHYKPFSVTELYSMGANGNRLNNTVVASGSKKGFCQADTDRPAAPGTLYVAPMLFTAPNCLFPRVVWGGVRKFVTGTGTGNGDTYQKELPGQYVNADNLPSGTYRGETTFDPDGNLLESTTSNNCVAFAVRVTGMGTNSPHAELLNMTLPPCFS